jgi:hypothetical protein
MRVTAKNPWGALDSGYDQQRTDLWLVDLDVPAKDMGIAIDSTRLYATNVKFPDLDTTADVFRRDSRPYYLPGYDKPVELASITFVYPLPNVGQEYPAIYLLLSKWRALVRAGRGSMSGEPQAFISAEGNYSLKSSWDIPVRLLRGERPSDPGVASVSFTDSGLPALITSSAHILKNAWLVSLGVSELDMGSAKGLEIKASFACEDVLLASRDSTNYAS